MKILRSWMLCLAKLIPRLVPDILAAGGVVCIAYGASLICLPAGWIVGGVLAILAAVIWSKGGGAE